MKENNIVGFFTNSSMIRYSVTEFKKYPLSQEQHIDLSPKDGSIRWLNTYGTQYQIAFKEVIKQNNLDRFLIKLFAEQHTNKVIELDDILFVAINILITEENSFSTEQMFFILSNDFVWSIQEKPGDYFQWIRERLSKNIGIARTKNADYLLFLILESIVDNYEATFNELSTFNDKMFSVSKVKPTPEFTTLVEERRREILNFKKAAKTLRDTIAKLNRVQVVNVEGKFFSELVEQCNNLIYDIDSELQEIESNINLIFSIQGHYLNEVMKTLTIFSVIFIPLTFLAGIYGMNFKYIPELETQYGYFVLLGVMFIITLFSVWYFRRKNWF